MTMKTEELITRIYLRCAYPAPSKIWLPITWWTCALIVAASIASVLVPLYLETRR